MALAMPPCVPERRMEDAISLAFSLGCGKVTRVLVPVATSLLAEFFVGEE
jgi:hypothetical protein